MSPRFAPVVRDLQDRYGLRSYSGFVYGRDGRADLDELGWIPSACGSFPSSSNAFGQRRPADMDFLRRKEQE